MPEVEAATGSNIGATLAFTAINQQFSHLLGRVLTVVDAAFVDPVQRKAVKDLMRAEFKEQTNHCYNLCFTFGQEGGIVLDGGDSPPDRF